MKFGDLKHGQKLELLKDLHALSDPEADLSYQHFTLEQILAKLPKVLEAGIILVYDEQDPDEDLAYLRTPKHYPITMHKMRQIDETLYKVL